MDRGERGRDLRLHRRKHLTSVGGKNDNEEAGENAREIKQAAMAHGVDARALLHLTIEDMEKIGATAGIVGAAASAP